MHSPATQFVLSNGLSIPAVGFGTYKTGDGDGAVLSNAIAQGYRHFDTASFYGTEEALGRAVAERDIPREDFFLTSKLWKTEMGYDAALRAFDATLERLGTGYLDLYLIHWPRPDLELEDWAKLDRETWRALERLYESGLVRAIGVSNFLPHHLEPILASANVAPMVDQLEFHPGYTQDETVAFCQSHNILVEAWSPLGRNRLAGNGVLARLAAEHGVSPAQICLRFALQRGVLPLPKSSSPERMAENLDLFSFSLTEKDMAALNAMPQTGWSGEHPDRPRVRFQEVN
ncbi:aldo/keto reductase [Pseudoflavonifractor sp.]|jgi:diketogulonate reductase-like aldo/keto reductase|uniref:aldo/keto reductase n=1 Tax=Pseudoflavonifractor sp. TaxID=1980281 RepID=UPI003D8DA649